jgi:hypothetical protein
MIEAIHAVVSDESLRDEQQLEVALAEQLSAGLPWWTA